MRLKTIPAAYKTTLVWFTLVLLLSCSSNRGKEIDEPSLQKKWKLEELALIKQYLSTEVKKDSIFLLSQPHVVQLTDCLREVIKDMPNENFSQEDFLSRAGKDTVAWSAGAIPLVRILPAENLPGRNESEKWDNLFQSVGGGYFRLSHVFFSKDLQYAILHVEFSCGSRCGQEMTILFQKNTQGWMIRKKYCLKVS